MKTEMKGKFVLVVRIETKMPFEFKHNHWHIDSNPKALPLNSLTVRKFEVVHFEFEYIKGSKDQTLQQVAIFCFKGLQKQLAPLKVKLLEFWKDVEEQEEQLAIDFESSEL